MVEQKIEFRKIRDFSENVNDTFQFIKLNFKPLLKSFFAICAIFMLLQSILQGVSQARYSFLWTRLFNNAYWGTGPTADVFGFQYFLTLLVPLFTYSAMQVTIGGYIKFYVENNGQMPGIEDVWKIFRKYYFKILLFTLPVFFTIGLGTLFCILPGVYLWVALGPFVMVVMMEDRGFIDTYSRCFELVKDHFWMSFAIYLIVFLISYITSLEIGAVVSGIFGLINYLTTKDLSITIGVVTSFFSIFSLSFYMVFLVSIFLNYFNLAEMKDGTGILYRIDGLGIKKSEFDNIEEQY